MTSSIKKSVLTGQLAMTSRIHECMNSSTLFYRFVFGCVDRHRYGDWGECSHHDSECNDVALDSGGRILSSYDLPPAAEISGESRVWIITEADRSSTTVLFPSDY